MTTSLATTIQPTIWQDATPEAQVNDIIRRPFTPIARVINKEILADGRTCLLVTFPGCRDHGNEEWVLPAVEVVVDVIPVKDAIVKVTAVAGNSECYADGIRRDSAIGKLRAKEEKATAAMWKQDDQAWYKVAENNYNRAEIHRDQKGLTSKKIQIMHWWSGHPEGVGPMWVNISDLLTDEQYSEQKQAEAKKRTPAPATSETDQQPPGRGDGRGRVQPIAKTDKKLAAPFKNRPKQYKQFLIIRKELAAIGVKVGTLINSLEDIKGWRLDWDGNKAGLFWTVGNGWEVSSRKAETELTGNWEGFDLMEHLDCNGIDLDAENQ